MEIRFSTKKLAKVLNNDKHIITTYGDRVARRIMRRLADLSAAPSLEDMRRLPGRCHELVGNKKGEWAIDLVHPYRLIFVPTEEPIPINQNGSYDWSKIKAITIIGVVDYH